MVELQLLLLDIRGLVCWRIFFIFYLCLFKFTRRVSLLIFCYCLEVFLVIFNEQDMGFFYILVDGKGVGRGQQSVGEIFVRFILRVELFFFVVFLRVEKSCALGYVGGWYFVMCEYIWFLFFGNLGFIGEERVVSGYIDILFDLEVLMKCNLSLQ